MSRHQGQYGCRGRLRKRKKLYAKTELPGEATAGDDKQGSLKAALRQSLATGKSRPPAAGRALRYPAAGNSLEQSLGAVPGGQQFGHSRRWRPEPPTAALRWEAALDARVALNYRFALPANSAGDPELPVVLSISGPSWTSMYGQYLPVEGSLQCSASWPTTFLCAMPIRVHIKHS